MAERRVIAGVLFSLRKAETQPGEEICVVGSNAWLGHWDPQRSVKLSTDADSYPYWSTQEVIWLLDDDTGFAEFEYKYIRDRRKLGGETVWEEDIPNRRVRLCPVNGKANVWLVGDEFWGETGSTISVCAEQQLSDNHDFTPSTRIFSQNQLSGIDDVPSDTQLAREMSVCSGISRVVSCSVLPEGRSLAVNNSLSPEREPMQDVALNGPMDASPQDNTKSDAPGAFGEAYSVLGDNPIGTGSFGLVWRCVPRTHLFDGNASGGGIVRAVKKITMSKLLPRDIQNLFGHEYREGEIRMHQAVKHPHIIELFQVFQEPHIVSLVMECCLGGDLFDLITSHGAGLPEPGTARMQRHLLEALAFLHAHDIVHRDVKCENVLILEEGKPIEMSTFKLCDLGFAARLGSDSQKLHTKLGSPDNVAPEIARGEAYGAPVDCWAAGVLLYMALAARPPFCAATDLEVLMKVREGNYDLSSGTWQQRSEHAKHVVRRLMTFQAFDRATARDALALGWFKP
mmetsp:Transcript_13386/g.26288  ORF Transcript_13386/g.26288 Transcript_13386/m.26288 type:complete len:512 (-) Transcript_13386:176-1711(-)